MSASGKRDRLTGLSQNYPTLAALEAPGDIKSLSEQDLESLASELRNAIIEVVSNGGGHLASPLGAVELAVAIHHVFDASSDDIIWDVGHQAYAHKLLTDRRDTFHTLRKKGGISGYPSRAESEYDSFGTGHSSTSISAGLGMAVARGLSGEDGHTIVVIGDGALTGGMAYEAMSHAGHLKKNMLIILNDNEMSISRNVGALSTTLSRLITGGTYNRAKGDLKNFMEHTLGKHLTETARRIEHSFKSMLIPGAFFEELGIRYIGPIDGNDLRTLVDCLKNLKDVQRPILFHCVTQKGKGYVHAEDDPLKYHGVIPYDIDTGEFQKYTSRPNGDPEKDRSFTQAFSDALIEAAEKDDSVVAVTAGMSTGTGLDKFGEKFPERFFDVGICEQHAVTFAAGLATKGLKPVAAIYSTFLQRGYDQFIHDVCLQNLPVVFPIDRAGLVGEDSPTQQGAFDVSFLRVIPNVTLLAPRDNVDLRLALHFALDQEGPVGLRYGRCKGPTIGDPEDRDVSRGEILRTGSDAYFLTLGPVAGVCLEAAEALAEAGYSVGVADARFIKPLDSQLIETICDVPIITVEENTLEGGFGSAVLEYFETRGRLRDVRIRRLGIPDRFIPHATRQEQLDDLGFNVGGLSQVVRDLVGAPIPHSVK